jgi:hypothetical protein
LLVTIHELNSAKFGELLAVKFDELRQHITQPHDTGPEGPIQLKAQG